MPAPNIPVAIDAATPQIACHHARWDRNRAVIAGEEAVKAAGETYLRRYPKMSDAEYAAYLWSVDFFPGAHRSHEGNVGLIFRKSPTITGADGVEDILETITDVFDNEQLSRELVSETLITNWSGLLVDAPAMPTDRSITKAQAIAGGYRPSLAVYRAEAILEITPTRVNNKRVIAKVRLLDDCDTVRVLELINGIYTATIHRKSEAGWVPDETITPLQNGQPMTEIPFKIVSTQAGAWTPPKAPMDDLCLLNLQHYRAQARLNNVLNYIGGPQRYITGLTDFEDEICVSVDSVWQFKGGSKDEQEVKVGISEHSGQGVAELREYASGKKDEMAAIGSRILQSDKLVGEAAETLAIRRASENSTLAAIANAVSAIQEASINDLLSWIGHEPVSYALNVDFLPMAIDALTLQTLFAIHQGGGMSFETFFAALRAGEIYPESLTYDEEKRRIDQDKIDMPTLAVAQPISTGAAAF